MNSGKSLRNLDSIAQMRLFRIQSSRMRWMPACNKKSYSMCIFLKIKPNHSCSENHAHGKSLSRKDMNANTHTHTVELAPHAACFGWSWQVTWALMAVYGALPFCFGFDSYFCQVDFGQWCVRDADPASYPYTDTHTPINRIVLFENSTHARPTHSILN